MIINCDIGERGAGHPVDLELMNYIGMANIACGGHAGDDESIEVFTRIAREKAVLISAHLSYPDRENFGRISLQLSPEKLRSALDAQLEASLEKERVKLHGALYNDCNADANLALTLADWLVSRGVREVVAPFDSHLALLCAQRGMNIRQEAFAERRYAYDAASGQLRLVSRTLPYALIETLDEALQQCLSIIHRGTVQAVMAGAGEGGRSFIEKHLPAQTLCIHSDANIALPLARGLADILRGGS